MPESKTTPRAYSLNEIDRMREAIRWSYLDGVSFYPAERDANIEDRIRTYMAIEARIMTARHPR
jgi:hypothetical protein